MDSPGVIKALTQYARDRRSDIQSPIRKPDASLPEIRNFFKQVPGLVTQKNQRRGCLICNTGVEIGKRDPEIYIFVNDFYREVAEVMKVCLERAIEKGQLKASRDITNLASYLATEFRASFMLAASGVSRREIERHFGVALRVLD